MNAENFREADAVRRQRLAQRYPDSWQHLCRDILLLYAKFGSNKPSGKPIGAPTLRKEIMRDEDALAANGFDDRLNEGHLSAWLRAKTKKLSEIQFSFVDKFIHTLPLNESAYAPIKSELYKHASDKIRGSLISVYSSRALYSSKKVPEYLKPLDNATFVCKPLSGWQWNTPISGIKRRLDFTQIALHFSEYRFGMFAVKAIYSKIPFWKLKDGVIDPRDTVEYHGFLIDLFAHEPSYPSGVLHLSKKGMNGIFSGGPFTVSTFSFADEEDGHELVTDWMPQVILPTVKAFLAETPPYQIPDLHLAASNEGKRDEWYTSRGKLIFERINDEYGFVGEYLSGLTDEYLIW